MEDEVWRLGRMCRHLRESFMTLKKDLRMIGHAREDTFTILTTKRGFETMRIVQNGGKLSSEPPKYRDYRIDENSQENKNG